jgi:hypothetical protein
MQWLLDNRRDLASTLTCSPTRQDQGAGTCCSRCRRESWLLRALKYVLDEERVLVALRDPLAVEAPRAPPVRAEGRREHRVDYSPGDSTTRMFGGNSNWRGPIWFPLNFLFVEALERYHFYYGDELKVECPTGSGNLMTLKQVAREIARRLGRIFLPGEHGLVPCHGRFAETFRDAPGFQDLLLFHEYFHGDTGAGLGADHQTGWTPATPRTMRERDSAPNVGRRSPSSRSRRTIPSSAPRSADAIA